MLDVLKSWIDTHLSDEEALIMAVILGLLFVVILTMGAILAPVLISIVLAFVLQGVVNLFEKNRVPRWLSIMCTYVLFLGGFIAFLFFIVPIVWKQMQALYRELPDMILEAQEIMAALPQNYPDYISQRQVDSWADILNAEVGEFGQWILSASLSQLPILVTFVIYMLLVPIFVFFFLKDKDELISWMMSFLPTRRPLMDWIGGEMNEQMENYVRGKFAEFLIIGGSTYLLFIAFGLEYAALLAFLVGLSVIIPYVGFVAVTIPVVIIGYMQFGWGMTFVYLVLGYSALQALDGFVLVPWLFSEANNLHPVAIIIAVLVFGSWWGVWGVFFAIPLATLIKAVMTAWPSTRSNRAAAAGESA